MNLILIHLINEDMPWVRIELTSLWLQYSALTTKQPRLLMIIFIYFFILEFTCKL